MSCAPGLASPQPRKHRMAPVSRQRAYCFPFLSQAYDGCWKIVVSPEGVTSSSSGVVDDSITRKSNLIAGLKNMWNLICYMY